MNNLTNQAKIYLEMVTQGPPIYTMEPKTVREFSALAPKPDIRLEELSKIEDRLISVGDADEINIRIYTPEGEGPFPIFVYYHGGGWVLGTLDNADPSCRLIANRTNSIVVSVDYRLAPEYKFPIPLNDSYEALKWVNENAESLNGSASKIIVGGDSAGGNLAAAVSMLARDQQGPEISAQVLLYPVTSLEYNTSSYELFKEGYGLDKQLMIWFGNHYINNDFDRKNPYIAPLSANDLSNLPPAIIITAENDVLRDEGMAYAQRLKDAGVTVEVFCEEGLVHGYVSFMEIFAEQIEKSVSKVAQFLSENLHTLSK